MIRTFLEPHAMKKDERLGFDVVDQDSSEEYRLLEALGQPKVFYAMKANKYFKNPESTNEFSASEIKAIGLPSETDIAELRHKLVKAANDAGQAVDWKHVYEATTPKTLLPPPEINSKLVSNDPFDRMIRRLNSSTLGK